MSEHTTARRSGRVLAISITTTAAQVVGASTQRVVLVFSPPASGSYTVSTEPSVAVGEGMVLVAGGDFLTLSREIHGDAVAKPWTAVAPVGVSAGVVEVTEG